MMESLYPTSTKTTRSNTGAAEQALRVLASDWLRKRMGTDIRILHEVALGDCRVDLLAVAERDLIGIEIKGPKDRLDERLQRQLREYRFYLPEVWLLVDAKWLEHKSYEGLSYSNKLAVVDGVVTPYWKFRYDKPHRDEMCCSRLLELLWRDEAARIAERTSVIPGCLRHKQMTRDKIKKMLARLLTGNEILVNVCRELRSRPLVGIGSDAPTRGTNGKKSANKRSLV